MSSKGDIVSIEQILEQVRSFLGQGRYKDAMNVVNVGLIYFPRHPELIALFKKIPPQYDADFYGDAYAVSHASAELYLKVLQGIYDAKSVVDVGAGVGAWSHAAVNLGKAVVSIDGEWVEKLDKPCRSLNYVYQDLNYQVQLDCASDLAICVEVAEHLMPERSESFVADLCNLARVVIFGAALPRQGGSGHINCRPHSFWIDQFDRRGFSVLDVFRPVFWYDGRVGPWYAQNTYLFVHRSVLTKFKVAPPKPTLVDVYHPRVVLDCPICLQDHLSGVVDPSAAQVG